MFTEKMLYLKLNMETRMWLPCLPYSSELELVIWSFSWFIQVTCAPFFLFILLSERKFRFAICFWLLIILIFVIGGTSVAWFGGSESSPSTESHVDMDTSIGTKKRSPLNANLFGSVCYTFQHGRFTKLYGDLTRVDARLDICSASAVAKRVFNIFRRSSFSNADNPLSSPKLSLILQQQVLFFLLHLWLASMS